MSAESTRHGSVYNLYDNDGEPGAFLEDTLVANIDARKSDGSDTPAGSYAISGRATHDEGFHFDGPVGWDTTYLVDRRSGYGPVKVDVS